MVSRCQKTLLTSFAENRHISIQAPNTSTPSTYRPCMLPPGHVPPCRCQPSAAWACALSPCTWECGAQPSAPQTGGRSAGMAPSPACQHTLHSKNRAHKNMYRRLICQSLLSAILTAFWKGTHCCGDCPWMIFSGLKSPPGLR